MIIGIVTPPIVFRIGRHLLVILPLHASDVCRPSNGSRDLLLFDGVVRCNRSGRDTPSATNAGGPLDLHEYLELTSLPSSIDGSLAPSFNSTLLGDVIAVAWVQENARWDRFPSSHLGQLNSPKRNTLENAFSFFKLPLKFFDQRRKSKRYILGKNWGRSTARAPWASRTRPAGLPRFAGRFGPVFYVPVLFRIFSP
jgi:hypothetical protein